MIFFFFCFFSSVECFWFYCSTTAEWWKSKAVFFEVSVRNQKQIPSFQRDGKKDKGKTRRILYCVDNLFFQEYFAMERSYNTIVWIFSCWNREKYLLHPVLSNILTMMAPWLIAVADFLTTALAKLLMLAATWRFMAA